MGGYPGIDLISHRRDDRHYHKKRSELRKYLPVLNAYLKGIKTDGEGDRRLNYQILQDFAKQIADNNIRVPMHILLRGEDLMRREVLKSDHVQSSIVEAVWRSRGFRMAVSKKLVDCAEKYGHYPVQGSASMEEYLFNRAKTKEEYLELAARVILYIKDDSFRQSVRSKCTDLKDPILIVEPPSPLKRKTSDDQSDEGPCQPKMPKLPELKPVGIFDLRPTRSERKCDASN